MALVVFLRGVNVGGHRTLRPARLAAELEHLGAVNIGAAGTFVIRARMTHAQLRAEFTRRIPFDTEIMICPGREITDLVSREPFAGQPTGATITRFVSVLSRRPRLAPPIPVRFPTGGRWLLRLIALEGRYVLGLYRREMRAVGQLGTLDQYFGTPATTRNWNTIGAIAQELISTSPRAS